MRMTHYVLGVIRQGSRHLVANGKDYNLAPGDLLFLNPGDVHGCEQNSPTLLVYDSLVVPIALFNARPLPGPVLQDPFIIQAFE